MSDHWSSQYVGLPYLTGGRDRDGLDCWGLVRLVHAEQFKNELPSFADNYASPHDSRIQELIARHRESWGRVDSPQPGDVVVFRVWGGLQHVGVVTEPGFFLHIRSGRTATVERLAGSIWRNRVEGIYRYEGKPETVSVAGLTHPLRTVRLDGEVPAGLTIAEIQEWIYAQTCTPGEVNRSRAIITVDGFTIPPDRWATVKPLPGQRVEYRAIAEGDSFKSILSISVLLGAMLLAPVLAPYLVGAAGGLGLGLSLSTATALATAAIGATGAVLSNYLFPTRTGSGKGQDTQKESNILLGGANQANPYGAIPVVLGQVKYTPPIAATNYAETYGESSYLRTILCWGYGPLQVSDIRLGDLPIGSLSEINFATLSGEAGEDNTRLTRLYPQDVTQEVPNVQLDATEWLYNEWSRTASGVVTLTSNTYFHEATVGQLVLAVHENNKYYPITQIVNGRTLRYQSTIMSAGSGSGVSRSHVANYATVILPGEVSEINVAIHFPVGIIGRKVSGTKKVGEMTPADFSATIQVRQLDSATLAPVSDWGNVNRSSPATTERLPPAEFNIDSDAALEPVYQWHIVSVNEVNKIIIRSGAYTTDQNADPTGNLLDRLQNANTGYNVTFNRLPTIGPGEVELWRVLVLGDNIASTVDRRNAANFTITGGNLTYSGRTITVGAATLARADQEVVKFRQVKIKDPFTKNVSIDVPTGRWEVRVVRTTDSMEELTNPGGSTDATYLYYYQAFVVAVTGFNNNKPLNVPKPLAMTAIRVRASNQLNGNIEGFTGVCTSICKDWDNESSIWRTRPTRNPAALFRYVLQHPANAQAVADSDIDLDALATWHNFCRNNAFMCDMLVVDQRSILEVLRDIAACGRASPALRDGKWTVIVDKPNETISQYFTPANSWGFEGQRAYPKMPHAFRVQFNNSERSWIADEMLVYNDGYSSANATLFEALSLPGVTTRQAIYKHARFHLAQLKLRPETYTLNADIEHLICQRGDRVKITHDVPMWGTASGRIKEYVNSTNLILSEPIPMDNGVQYGIRIRLDDGSSITRTIAAKSVSGLYSDITLTAGVNSSQGAAGNLFMVGTLNAESVDCLVLSVEPQENMTARLTLVDYAPAVYDSDTEVIPEFNSQITKPPELAQNVITQAPSINRIVSDESMMIILSNSQYGYRIGVTYTVPGNLPRGIAHVEGQIIETDSYDSGKWVSGGTVPLGQALMFSDVQRGESYRTRLRLVSSDGRSGPWVVSNSHTVSGRSIPPSNVQNLSLAVNSGKLSLQWDQNPELDVIDYEVRTENSNWGTAGYVARLSSTVLEVEPALAGATRTLYVKARDSADLLSETAAEISLTTTGPGTVPVPTQSINKIASGTIVLGVDWAASSAGTFPVDGYEIRSADSGWNTSGYLYRGATSAVVLNGISATSPTTFYIKAYDTRGNYSTTARSFVHDVTPPETMSAATLSVVRRAATLNITISNAPAIPADFDAYEFRIGQVRAAATSGSDTPAAVVSGSTDNFWNDPDCTIIRSTTSRASVDIRTFDKPRFNASGLVYRVACRMRDKSGNYSAASALGSISVTSIT
jgi:hypothetical protein